MDEAPVYRNVSTNVRSRWTIAVVGLLSLAVQALLASMAKDSSPTAWAIALGVQAAFYAWMAFFGTTFTVEVTATDVKWWSALAFGRCVRSWPIGGRIERSDLASAEVADISGRAGLSVLFRLHGTPWGVDSPGPAVVLHRRTHRWNAIIVTRDANGLVDALGLDGATANG